MMYTCDYSDAFENFFHDWAEGPKVYEWGPEYWSQHGVKVVNSKVEFDTPEHRTMFLLRWS